MPFITTDETTDWMDSKIWWVFLLMVLISNSSRAQKGIFENFSIARYTDADGLPQNSVKSIAADAEGFVWFITEGGLVRFDGRQFATYNKFNLGISDNRFYAIFPSQRKGPHKDADSKLFAATDQGAFIKIEGGKAIYDPAYSQTWGAPTLAFHQKHIIGAFVALGLPIIQGQNLHSIKRYIVPVAGREGAFYLCDSNSIAFYEGWQKKMTMPFKSSRIWNYFLIKGRLCHFNSNGSITGIDHRGTYNYALTGDILNDATYASAKERMKLYWNNANDQAFLCLGKNLYFLTASGDNQIQTTLLIKGFDLAGRNIKTIYYHSADQALFLGSVTQGLFMIRNQPFKPIITNGGEFENVFYAQTRYGKNGVVVPQGIAFESEEGSDGVFEKRLSGTLKENGADKRGMLTDKFGNLWVKNFQYLSRYDQTGEKKLNHWDLKDEVKTIYIAEDGVIWIGLKKRGLFRANPAAANPAPEQFLSGTDNVSFIESKTPQLLLVGTEHGLYEVDLPAKKALIVSGTQKLFIKSIYAPRPDQVWFTVQDQGIMLLHKNKLVAFPLDDKKYLAASHCILEDKHDFFWVTTNKGLFRIKKSDLLSFAARAQMSGHNQGMSADLYYEYHDKGEGFLINEFNGGCQPCGLQLKSGVVSLPSLKGLIWFVPESISAPSLQGGIFIDRIAVDRQALPVKDSLILTEASKRIRFYFSTPYFGHADNLHLSYALIENGSQVAGQDWTQIDESYFNVYFSTLNSGDYTLLVKKVNGFGPRNYSIRALNITVPPLWHQTWWAKLGYLTIFIACVFLLFRIRENRIKRENHVLETKVAQRTDELEASMDEQSRQLQIMSRLLTSMSHDIQSPLNFINRASKYVPKLIKKGDLEDAGELADSISESTESVGALLTGLLDYLKAYLYGKTMTFEAVNLQNLVNDKLGVFRNLLEFKHNTVNTEIPENLTVYSDNQMLAIIVHNLIDNAVKFTENGEIGIVAYKSENKVTLLISNNGQPLSKHLLQMFNDGQSFDTKQGSGLGFFLVRQIAELINVEVSVRQNQRTEFYLMFEAHLQ